MTDPEDNGDFHQRREMNNIMKQTKEMETKQSSLK